MTRVLVISDSSSLIIGTKAGLLDAMCDEFLVEIPEKVFEETVIAGKELQKIDALKIEEAIEENKIVIKKAEPLKESKAAKWLSQLNLDKGEMEAIKLYIQTNAKLLLVDGRQAINAAKLLEINWATIPDIIVEFAVRKKIPRETALEALKIAQREGRYKIDFILKAFTKIEKIKGGKK